MPVKSALQQTSLKATIAQVITSLAATIEQITNLPCLRLSCNKFLLEILYVKYDALQIYIPDMLV